MSGAPLALVLIHENPNRTGSPRNDEPVSVRTTCPPYLPLADAEQLGQGLAMCIVGLPEGGQIASGGRQTRVSEARLDIADLQILEERARSGGAARPASACRPWSAASGSSGGRRGAACPSAGRPARSAAVRSEAPPPAEHGIEILGANIGPTVRLGRTGGQTIAGLWAPRSSMSSTTMAWLWPGMMRARTCRTRRSMA